MPEFRFSGTLDGVPSDLRPGDARVGSALAAAPIPIDGTVMTIAQVIARGGGATTLTATTPIAAWTAVVPDGATGCAPASPSNPDHFGRVLGVTAEPAEQGESVSVRMVGLLESSTTGGFPSDAVLFVGPAGAITPTAPSSGWRQIVGTSATPSRIVVALGEASLVEDEGDALIAPGGFALPCGLDQAADPFAVGTYVTPAANALALGAKANLGHTSVFDQDYAGSPSDVQVGFRTLTAPRIYSLPDVDAYPLGQDHVVADESGACSDALTITVRPGPSTGDIIGSPEGAATIALSSPYQAVRFRRGAANLWIRV